jgi:hypothetical protein
MNDINGHFNTCMCSCARSDLKTAWGNPQTRTPTTQKPRIADNSDVIAVIRRSKGRNMPARLILLVWSPSSYLVKSTNYGAPHYSSCLFNRLRSKYYAKHVVLVVCMGWNFRILAGLTRRQVRAPIYCMPYLARSKPEYHLCYRARP